MVHVKTEIWLRNKKVFNLPVRFVHPWNPRDAAGARSTLMSVSGKREQAPSQAGHEHPKLESRVMGC